MKRLLAMLTALGFCGLWLAAPCYAETIHGKVGSIDSDAGTIRVVPEDATSADDESGLTVSVTRFLQSSGLPKLQDLEVGDSVVLDVQKDSSGRRWEMTTLSKPNAGPMPSSTVDPNSKYLKTRRQEKSPGRKASLKRYDTNFLESESNPRHAK